MAFTLTEKAKIRFYLGYQDLFRDINTSLESQLSATGISAEAQTIVKSILSSLADIDTKLLGSHTRLKASTVGSIKLNAEELYQLRGEGRRFVLRLSSIFGVSPREDIYGEGAGASGGVIPLG